MSITISYQIETCRDCHYFELDTDSDYQSTFICCLTGDWCVRIDDRNPIMNTCPFKEK